MLHVDPGSIINSNSNLVSFLLSQMANFYNLMYIFALRLLSLLGVDYFNSSKERFQPNLLPNE